MVSYLQGAMDLSRRINDNAYKLDLPGEFNISATFNVANLSPFLTYYERDLRTNPSQEKGNDTGDCEEQAVQASSFDLVKVLVGLVMRARAKKSKESLQTLVRAVQEQEGVHKFIEGVESQSIKVVIQVEDNDGDPPNNP